MMNLMTSQHSNRPIFKKMFFNNRILRRTEVLTTLVEIAQLKATIVLQEETRLGRSQVIEVMPQVSPPKDVL
jgi:hypothetical protein